MPNSIILKTSIDNDIVFSGKYKDAIFSEKMIHYPNKDGHRDHDPIQEYNLNSSGYRGPEFTSGVDLVVAGCSFTYGMGVPESGTWGSILSKSLGMTYNNVSQNGASIPWIVRQLFAYFNEYGNPKVLVCLFPSLTRSFFTSNAEILIADSGYVEDSTKDLESKKSIYNVELQSTRPLNKRPKYSKRPHDLEDIVNVDMAVQISMQNIRMLEQYCKSSNIKFVWGTWNEPFCSMMEGQGLYYQYDFSHYVPTGYLKWQGKNAPVCHENLLSKYKDSFYLGTDTLQGRPHFGVHRHTHFAESFIEALGR